MPPRIDEWPWRLRQKFGENPQLARALIALPNDIFNTGETGGHNIHHKTYFVYHTV